MSPQNKNEKKLYLRAMRMLEKFEQTDFWNIAIKPYEDKKKQIRYRLHFTLNREFVKTYNRIGHYYILQTDLSEDVISDQQVVDSYKSLIQVECSFHDFKSQISIRPIRHWKERRN